MKALKTLIAVMGILIVGLMTVLGYGLYRKGTDPDFRFFDLGGGTPETTTPTGPTPPLAGTPPAADTAPQGFATRDLGLAPGAEVREIAAADGRLYIHVRLPSGLEQILVLNTADGRILGIVNVNR